MPPTHHNVQRGFTLPQMLALGLVLTAMVSSGALLLQHRHLQAKGNLLAGQLQQLNAGLGNYLTGHHNQLLALPPECAGIALQAGSPPAPVTSDCQLREGSAVLAQNGLQPTLTELIALAFIAPGNGYPLPLPGRTVMYQPDGNFAPAGWLFSITPVCAEENSITPLSALCPANRRSLQSLIFNNQPLETAGHRVYWLNAILSVADTAITSLLPNHNGNLLQGDNFTLQNPLGDQKIVLVIKNGAGASRWQNYGLRAGGALPTADWDFAGFNIANLANLQTREMAVLATREPGSPCVFGAENIAVATNTKTMVVCDASEGIWVLVGAGFGSP